MIVRRFWALAAPVLGSLIGASTVFASANLEELYGSGLAVVKKPDRIFASLLKEEMATGAPRTRRERTPRLEIPKESEAALIAKMLSSKSYAWNVGNPCVPVFGAS